MPGIKTRLCKTDELNQRELNQAETCPEQA